MRVLYMLKDLQIISERIEVYNHIDGTSYHITYYGTNSVTEEDISSRILQDVNRFARITYDVSQSTLDLNWTSKVAHISSGEKSIGFLCSGVTHAIDLKN